MSITVEAPDPLSPDAGRRLRVAVAHDWLCGMRGGEQVLDAILRWLVPRADVDALYLMFDNRRPHTDAIDHVRHVRSAIGSLPLASGPLRRWLLPFYPACVADLSRRLRSSAHDRPIDLLISTSSAAIKGLRPPPGVPHLCYIHRPARYAWNRREDYAGGLRGLGLSLFAGWFRSWDLASATNVSRFVANSTHTARQVNRCYGRDADVLFPPVRTGFFTPGGAQREGHWLLVSALEPYKRVDVAIDAARLAGARLRIVGSGSQERRLRSLGAPHAEFLGRIPDVALRDEYRRARLLIFPQVEDFGIVACEALACGLPVVARARGGALDIITDGVNGALADADRDEDLAGALAAGAGRAPADAQACRRSAERFSESAFMAGLARAVRRALAPG